MDERGFFVGDEEDAGDFAPVVAFYILEGVYDFDGIMTTYVIDADGNKHRDKESWLHSGVP